MAFSTQKYAGKKILLAGLGLNGGALSAAKYVLRLGAELSVTDLKDEAALKPSLDELNSYAAEHNCAKIRYCLGKHDAADFANADIVIKNPGMKPSSPYLQAAKCVTSDISLFLERNPARLITVTGSKGKSFTSSAISYALQQAKEAELFAGNVYLGGNITKSPLDFVESLMPDDTVVLELSSWQLADSPDALLPAARCAVITAILPDHQNWYASMEDYVADKRRIYKNQNEDCATIAFDDEWGRSFLRESRGRGLLFSRTKLPPDVAGAYAESADGAGYAQGVGGAPSSGKSVWHRVVATSDKKCLAPPKQSMEFSLRENSEQNLQRRLKLRSSFSQCLAPGARCLALGTPPSLSPVLRIFTRKTAKHSLLRRWTA
jgi:UDP-N-acetylmuramoylalanine--D-glutamate ligase